MKSGFPIGNPDFFVFLRLFLDGHLAATQGLAIEMGLIGFGSIADEVK